MYIAFKKISCNAVFFSAFYTKNLNLSTASRFPLELLKLLKVRFVNESALKFEWFIAGG